VRHTIIAAALAALALIANQASAGDVWVSITSPQDGAVAVGSVDVAAEVVAPSGVARVEFRVDGRLMGALVDPPFLYRVDLGGARMEHLIEVVAVDRDGARADAAVTTQPVPLGGEIALDLQQLYVTVELDSSRLLDLQQEAFVIVDEGEPQQLITFARGDIPFTAVLLIDSSVSMFGPKLEAAWVGADRFVQGMKDLDQGKIIIFSDSLIATTPFSDERDVLSSALGGALAHGGTAVNDHLYMALKLLDKRQGRRVIVLLSDGIDTHSVLSMSEVLNKARQCQVLIYWIRLVNRRSATVTAAETARLYSAWRDPREYRSELRMLEEAVTRSGGRITMVTSVDEVGPVFVDVLQELRDQYVLGYYPSKGSNDGRWHDIEVRVRHPLATVRTHEGYVDY
jgi:Ca-activated chloride channel family protein